MDEPKSFTGIYFNDQYQIGNMDEPEFCVGQEALGECVRITIPIRPVTKKNNPVMLKNCNLIIPSKAYRVYEKFCIGTKRNPGWLVQWANIQFTEKVHVCAKYWFPDKRSEPDLVGLLQCTADILEKAGIVKNDKLIRSWDYSRIMGIDKMNPRVEIVIRLLGVGK